MMNMIVKNTMNMIVKKKTIKFFLIGQSLVVHACDLSPLDAWEEDGHEFLTSVGYRVRSYLKMITTTTNWV